MNEKTEMKINVPQMNLPEMPFWEQKQQYWVLLTEEKRICKISDKQENEYMFLFEFPDDFEFSQHNNYKIINGELVFDEMVYEEIEPQPTEEQLRITELEQQLIETEISMTEMDLQNIETEQTVTDLDLRLTILEG